MCAGWCGMGWGQSLVRNRCPHRGPIALALALALVGRLPILSQFSPQFLPQFPCCTVVHWFVYLCLSVRVYLHWPNIGRLARITSGL